MTIPEKTGIYSLEEAVAAMAAKFGAPKTLQGIRRACRDGGTYQAILTVQHDENGYMVNVNVYRREKAGTFGTLIRLADREAA